MGSLPQNAIFILDGEQVSLDEARKLSIEQIKNIAIVKNSEKMLTKYG